MLARNQLHQITLDLFRILVFRQAKPLRQPDHVRVDHNPDILVKGIA
jgi:hypothetical protein